MENTAEVVDFNERYYASGGPGRKIVTFVGKLETVDGVACRVAFSVALVGVLRRDAVDEVIRTFNKYGGGHLMPGEVDAIEVT